jgi:hypothetical protein
MWKKIDTYDDVAAIKYGDCISSNPGDENFEYIIDKIFPVGFMLIKKEGNASRLFSDHELVNGDWWIRNKTSS